MTPDTVRCQRTIFARASDYTFGPLFIGGPPFLCAVSFVKGHPFGLPLLIFSLLLSGFVFLSIRRGTQWAEFDGDTISARRIGSWRIIEKPLDSISDIRENCSSVTGHYHLITFDSGPSLVLHHNEMRNLEHFMRILRDNLRNAA
jgi:hypothetical protein